MDETRDNELGRRLGVLSEPEHGPGYWSIVRHQVAAASAEAKATDTWTRLRSVFRLRSVRIAVAAAAVAVLAAAALLAGLPGTQGPPSVTAEEVLKRARAAYSSGRTWQSDVLTTDVQGGYVYLSRIIRSSDGSYRSFHYDSADGPVFSKRPYTGRHIIGMEVYDAQTGVYRAFDRPNHRFDIHVGYPLGPPDMQPKWSPGDLDPGALLRGLDASAAVKLGAGTLGGRPVWKVRFDAGEMLNYPSSDVDWDVYTYAVDKQTWLPISMSIEQGGMVLARCRFERVVVDDPLPPDAFTLPLKKGFRVKRLDLGFRRTSLEEASATRDVDPLVPGFVPAGYELARVAVAPHALTMNGIVRGKDIFELLYTGGFDSLTIATRTINDPYYKASEDPIELYPGMGWSALASRKAVIARGAFAGATARILVATKSSQPHLWAVKDKVLLTIAGGATGKELLAIAESLQDYRSTP